MKITKLGHCALRVEHNDAVLLTDPGNFTIEAQQEQKGVDIVLITHEHADHFHLESLKKIIEHNPNATIVTNASVGKLLAAEHILYTQVGNTESCEIKGIHIEGFGVTHAPIYGHIPDIENTGYMLAGKFYFPGDAFHNPGKQVDVLALPTAGPWMKISEAIDFAYEIKPRIAFPVHDGMIKPDGMFSKWPQDLLVKEGIEFISLNPGDSHEF